ncbi:AMP-binding protein, partial [Salmonella enterica]|uniref:AMP-binding protein n=1 Tax=Salmonella enterica TaxID=28901 RepID=UPI003CF78C6D
MSKGLFNSDSHLCCELDGFGVNFDKFLCHVTKLSSFLISKYGIQRGQRIAQCVERSIEMLIGIMAIVICGGVYV